jgi:hypothetical protein
MGNVIHNILMEQEFDVGSYGVDYKWKVPKILYILETKREKKNTKIFKIRRYENKF